MAANISTETYSILHDSRGEDVRDSLCEACEKIAPKLLPYVTTEDVGKVLGVNQYGKWVEARYIPYWRLQYITVTTQPTKTSYFVGDQLDLTGVVVTAYYGSDFESDKAEVVTSRCNFTPVDGSVLTYDTQSVHVEFSDGGVTATASIHLDVSLVLPVSLEVTTMPTKTEYESGDTLDLTGIVVTATYNNGTTADVASECTFTPVDGTVLTKSNRSIAVSYESEGVIVATSFAIRVNVPVASIMVTTPPVKSTYSQGETLDLSGIVVKAIYEDYVSRIVTSDCTFSPSNGSTLSRPGIQIVNISYTEDDLTVSTSINVMVEALEVVSIDITTLPTKTTYAQYDLIDMTGAVVTATLTNGMTADVTEDCEYGTFGDIHVVGNVGTETITVYYFNDPEDRNNGNYENAITASFDVTVTSDDASVRITTLPTKSSYTIGETLDLTGIVVQATYTIDGTVRDITSECRFSPPDGTVLSMAGTTQIFAYFRHKPTAPEHFDILNLHVAPQDTVPTGIFVKRFGRTDFTVYNIANDTCYDGFTSTGLMVCTENQYGEEIENVTSNCTLSIQNGYKFTREGPRTVTVTYQTTVNGSAVTFTTSYDIMVYKGFVEMIINSLPERTTYDVGEKLSLTGLRASVRYTDGSIKDVTDSEYFETEYKDGDIVDASWIHGGQCIEGCYYRAYGDGISSDEQVIGEFMLTINT